jgi:triphosphoribosyl-dephospho-CoA synthase
VLRETSVAPEPLAKAVEEACLTEIRALKPGNVSVHSEGHGMTARQFVVSAQAISPALTEPGISVGQRILQAVQATQATAGCNTNLGIVLLLAPLAHAALTRVGMGSLRARVSEVLGSLGTEDAELTYRAIRLANPAGLGRSERHDIRESPAVSLLEAMHQARERDLIARQYANGYRDVFALGISRARKAQARGFSEEWTAAAVYLGYLAHFPDTHIARKFGRRAAETVREEARRFDAELMRQDNPTHMMGALLAWDSRLKRDRYNPGSCADLTVATLFAIKAQVLLAGELSTRRSVRSAHDQTSERLRRAEDRPFDYAQNRLYGSRDRLGSG